MGGGVDAAMLAFLEGVKEGEDGVGLFGGDLAALVSEALAHGSPEGGCVDELDLAPALGGLAVGEDPYVGGDTGVVEELLGQGDEGFQPVVLEYPAADLAFPAPGVSREEGRAVHDEGDAGTALALLLAVREEVEKEEELAVRDAREARPEASGMTAFVLRLGVLLVALPVLAVRGIGNLVVEGGVRVAIVREGAAEGDALGVAPVGRLHVEVGFADGVGLGVDLLAEEVGVGLRVDGFSFPFARAVEVVLGDGEHPA